MSVLDLSLACRQIVFQWYHRENHLSEFYPQDGGESQLALKLRHCHPVYTRPLSAQLDIDVTTAKSLELIMRPIARDVAWSLCLCVGRTDRYVVWGVDSRGTKEPCISLGHGYAQERIDVRGGAFLGLLLSIRSIRHEPMLFGRWQQWWGVLLSELQ